MAKWQSLLTTPWPNEGEAVIVAVDTRPVTPRGGITVAAFTGHAAGTESHAWVMHVATRFPAAKFALTTASLAELGEEIAKLTFEARGEEGWRKAWIERRGLGEPY